MTIYASNNRRGNGNIRTAVIGFLAIVLVLMAGMSIPDRAFVERAQVAEAER